MPTIPTIRALIQDQPVQVQESLVFDGVQTSQRVKYFPLVSASVTVTGTAPSSIDGQSGVLTWAVAPSAGSHLVNYSFVQLLDSTIQALIDLQALDGEWSGETDQTYLVAALCLDAIASSQALILKRITLLDLKTDGPGVADALRKHAETLRKLVFSSESVEPSFEIIEQLNDIWGYREKILKDALREES